MYLAFGIALLHTSRTVPDLRLMPVGLNDILQYRFHEAIELVRRYVFNNEHIVVWLCRSYSKRWRRLVVAPFLMPTEAHLFKKEGAMVVPISVGPHSRELKSGIVHEKTTKLSTKRRDVLFLETMSCSLEHSADDGFVSNSQVDPVQGPVKLTIYYRESRSST
jgi:hypothetical protein